jgi:signal transduction histidine kinase
VRNDVLALIGVGILALALGLGVAWILAGSIARPINALAGVARRMAGGELDARAEPKGSSEQIQVASAFNEMADRLAAVLESQRAFVADASHQLRTPLTGIRLRLEAAAARSGREVGEELEAAERETERLATLVDDLLALAASEGPSDDRRAELGAAIESAVRRWRGPASEQGRELGVVGEQRPVEVHAGERDLAIILDNLIDNAIKYSPRGSAIEVTWAARERAAVLAVANSGDSVAAEERTRAFERFYRGRNSQRGSGTGLGLSIVAALARREGGRARLRNRDGGGVIAEVELPLLRPDFADS